ncbi:MAG: hypothetical protein RBT11_01590 [Desulfobacterales bacterium]|jgi:hypothetical protein|nr:hypothetical protein [Desulfobacterales bacterium]
MMGQLAEIREAVAYQTKLLETIVDQLDMREKTAAQARMDWEQHKKRISGMLTRMPGVAGNQQYQEAITNIFDTIGANK